MSGLAVTGNQYLWLVVSGQDGSPIGYYAHHCVAWTTNGTLTSNNQGQILIKFDQILTKPATVHKVYKNSGMSFYQDRKHNVQRRGGG